MPVQRPLSAGVAATVYKFDQVRLDMLYTHYGYLRLAFEVRLRANGDGMWRTRQWLQETMRPLLWDDDVNGPLHSSLLLDSHAARISIVLEAVLLTLFSPTCLSAKPLLSSVLWPAAVAVDARGFADLHTLPFPETLYTDAKALEQVSSLNASSRPPSTLHPHMCSLPCSCSRAGSVSHPQDGPRSCFVGGNCQGSS
jgi:hypothetical protein